MASLTNIADKNRQNLEEIEGLQKQVDDLVKEIDRTGPQNQVIRELLHGSRTSL